MQLHCRRFSNRIPDDYIIGSEDVANLGRYKEAELFFAKTINLYSDDGWVIGCDRHLKKLDPENKISQGRGFDDLPALEGANFTGPVIRRTVNLNRRETFMIVRPLDQFGDKTRRQVDLYLYVPADRLKILRDEVVEELSNDCTKIETYTNRKVQFTDDQGRTFITVARKDVTFKPTPLGDTLENVRKLLVDLKVVPSFYAGYVGRESLANLMDNYELLGKVLKGAPYKGKADKETGQEAA